MRTSKICYLDVSTFVGTAAIGARHYYGTLRGQLREEGAVDLERTLTRAEAAFENKERRRMGFNDPWKDQAGDVTRGFRTEEDLCAFAIAHYREHFPKATILVKGDHLNPGVILDGPDELKTKGKEIYDESESLQPKNRFDRTNDRKLIQLCEQWRALLKPYAGDAENTLALVRPKDVPDRANSRKGGE